jgi:hypothetical protein
MVKAHKRELAILDDAWGRLVAWYDQRPLGCVCRSQLAPLVMAWQRFRESPRGEGLAEQRRNLLTAIKLRQRWVANDPDAEDIQLGAVSLDAVATPAGADKGDADAKAQASYLTLDDRWQHVQIWGGVTQAPEIAPMLDKWLAFKAEWERESSWGPAFVPSSLEDKLSEQSANLQAAEQAAAAHGYVPTAPVGVPTREELHPVESAVRGVASAVSEKVGAASPWLAVGAGTAAVAVALAAWWTWGPRRRIGR